MPDGKLTPLRRAGNFEAAGLAIPGPLLITARRFADPRGTFMEVFSERDFAALGIAERFVQDNQSRSEAAGTLRGLHFQRPPAAQAKLVRVLRGRVLDVAVDLRAGSPEFGRHVAVELAAGDGRMLYIPAGFAHGFVTREPGTEVAYTASAYYAPELDAGLAWDDPALGIGWGIAPGAAVLSEKDRRLPRLAELGPVGF